MLQMTLCSHKPKLKRYSQSIAMSTTPHKTYMSMSSRSRSKSVMKMQFALNCSRSVRKDDEWSDESCSCNLVINKAHTSRVVFEAQTSDGESPEKSLAGICFCQIRRGMTKTSDGEVPRHPPLQIPPWCWGTKFVYLGTFPSGPSASHGPDCHMGLPGFVLYRVIITIVTDFILNWAAYW